MSAEKITQTPPEAVKKTVAIIQITRIGDILQTCHAARLLKINHPEFETLLVARKQFIEPVKFIVDQTFDKVVALDFKSAINLTDGVAGSVKNIAAQIAEVNKHPISASINLSFSKTSCYLHSLIQSEHKLGPYFSLDHNKTIQDKWSQYLYSTVMRGDLNPFNLVDLFSSIVGVNKKNTHLSNSEFSKEKKNNILLHPFASLGKKRWQENKWTEVIFKLLKDNKDLNIYIAGSKHDKDGFDKIVSNPILADLKSRIKPLLGLPVSDLYQKVDESFLFIGHDSMVSHLLSFKNVKSLTIALGTVRPQETAPYALNNYVLSPKTKCFPCFPDTKCDFYQCHADIPYQAVINMANQLLNANTIDKNRLQKDVSAFHLNSINIDKTTVNKVGQLTFTNILEDEKSAKQIFKDFYQIIWSYCFSEIDLNLEIPKFSRETTAMLKTSVKSVETLYELSEFGKKYTRYILEEISNNSPNLVLIKEHSTKIDEIDRLLDVLSEANPLLSPAIDFAKVAKNNLHGDNIVKMTESAFYVYQEISSVASIIYDFMNSLGVIETESANAQNKQPRTNV
jgi:ADP-heptose:LPS heptosyltransferase